MKKKDLVLKIMVLLISCSVGKTAMSQTVVKTVAVNAKHSNIRTTRTITKVHLVNEEVRSQTRQLEADLKSGKISQAQAKTVLAVLRDVRIKEKKFMAASSDGDITDDQAALLKQELSKNGQDL